MAQERLGLGRQALNARDHEVHDVVADLGAPDALEIPGPAAAAVVEGEEAVLVERAQQLAHEKRVAGALALDDRAQAAGGLEVGLQRAGDDHVDGVFGQRPQVQARHALGALDVSKRDGQGVLRAHLVVAVRADEQEGRALAALEQPLHERERGRVAPLQVVEEEHQRVLGAREGANQALNRHQKAVLLLGGVQGDHRRRLADHPGELRHQIDGDAPVRPEGRHQPFAPARQALLGLGHELAHQPAEGLRDGRVGQVPTELVELALEEPAVAADDRLAHVVDQCRLADAGGARDRHERGDGVGGRAEGLEDRAGLGVAVMQALGHAKLRHDVALSELEGRDLTGVAPAPLALAEIAQETLGALVAVLGVFGHELEHDAAEHGRHRGVDGLQGRGGLGDVAVHPLDRVGGLERQLPGEQAVEGHAQRVEVRAEVHIAVHAAGLLGRDEGQRPDQPPGGVGREALAGDLRGQAEVDEADLLGGGVPEDVAGVHVLVDDVLVQPPERPRAGQGQREEGLERHGRLVGELIGERARAAVLHHQGQVVAPRLEAEGPNRPGDLEGAQDAVLAAQAGEVLGGGVVLRDGLHDDGASVGDAHPAPDDRAGGAVEFLSQPVPRNQRLHRGYGPSPHGLFPPVSRRA
ncbi:hypothetical protein D3C72_905980 [compost metagenome]